MSDVQAETVAIEIAPDAAPVVDPAPVVSLEPPVVDSAPVVSVSLEPAVPVAPVVVDSTPVVDPLTDRIAALDAREAALEAREAEAAEKAAAGEAKQAEYESKLQGISEGVVHVLQQQADLAALIDAAHARDMAIKNAVADFVKATQ